MRRHSSAASHFLLILVLLLPPGLLSAQMKLGSISFKDVPAENLKEKMTLEKGRKSYRFLSGVGGVAFGQIAKPKRGLKVVGLDYDAKAKDGSRVKVTLKDATKETTVTASLHDWQLVPIARFAYESEHALVTPHGNLKDRADEKKRKKRGEWILNYHPSVGNTLLGLRLLQGSLLLGNAKSADLPKVGKKKPLGAGESPPNVKDNTSRQSSLNAYLDKLRGGPFAGYVVSDIDQKVTFSISKDGHLALTGNPYWHFWKKVITDKAQLAKVKKEAGELATKEVQKQVEAAQKDLSIAQLRSRYTEARRRAIKVDVYDKAVSKQLIREMAQYSRKLSAKILEFEGGNPAVYNALTATMRYAAFFRHVREVSPDLFSNFLIKVNKVKVKPPIKTPTVMLP